MNIYESSLEKVAQGANYSIDFKKRSLKVDGRLIIDCGKYEGNLHFSPNDSPDDVILVIEELYNVYKHSIPSEQTDSRRHTYFKALKEDDLSDDDMLYGEPRMPSMFNLEYYILAQILNGGLIWKDDWGWFWQSDKDSNLVILKEWIVGE